MPEPKALLKPRAASRLDRHRRQLLPGRKAPLRPIPAKLEMSVELDKLVGELERKVGHRQRLEAKNNRLRRKRHNFKTKSPRGAALHGVRLTNRVTLTCEGSTNVVDLPLRS